MSEIEKVAKEIEKLFNTYIPSADSSVCITISHWHIRELKKAELRAIVHTLKHLHIECSHCMGQRKINEHIDLAITQLEQLERE